MFTPLASIARRGGLHSMHLAEEATYLVAAQAGDHDAFARLIAPYRRELLIHCYRILGSLEDAEDALQEALIRAWRRLETFAGRASLRAWLYSIATNTALDARPERRVRSLPNMTLPAADPQDPPPLPTDEPLWLGPLPDALLDEATPGPEAHYDVREGISLAFLAALQLLPPRQRAVLILRDALGWRAAEVATLLDLTVAAANSALQRARLTMKQHRDVLTSGMGTPATDPRTAALLDHYVAAWEAADTSRLVALLREDAAYSMPPLPLWYRGPTDIQTFLTTQLFAGRPPGHFRLLPTQANGCPSFAVYVRDDAGIYRPSALQVLTIAGDSIAAIYAFLSADGAMFANFDLPLAI